MSRIDWSLWPLKREFWIPLGVGLVICACVGSAVAGSIHGHREGMDTSRKIWQSHLDEDGCLVVPRTYST